MDLVDARTKNMCAGEGNFTKVEESPLLEADTKQRVVETE